MLSPSTRSSALSPTDRTGVGEQGDDPVLRAAGGAGRVIHTTTSQRQPLSGLMRLSLPASISCDCSHNDSAGSLDLRDVPGPHGSAIVRPVEVIPLADLETGIGCDRHSLSSRLARPFLLGRRVELVKE